MIKIIFFYPPYLQINYTKNSHLHASMQWLMAHGASNAARALIRNSLALENASRSLGRSSRPAYKSNPKAFRRTHLENASHSLGRGSRKKWHAAIRNEFEICFANSSCALRFISTKIPRSKQACPGDLNKSRR